MHSAFFLASERRSTVDVLRGPGYKIWRLFKFEFSEVNINSQCLILNDRIFMHMSVKCVVSKNLLACMYVCTYIYMFRYHNYNSCSLK